MKILKYIIYSLVLSPLFFVSCTGDLDIDPIQNEVIQPDFQKIGDIQSSLFGVYSGFKGGSQYTGSLVAMGDWPADNLKVSAVNTGQGVLQHEWDYNEGDGVLEGMWVGSYAIIRRANFVITGVDGFEGAETTLANQYKAEALVLRSLALLNLHNLYGQRYVDGSELSVAYITDPNDILQEAARLTTNELLSNVEADLNAAIPNLPNTFNPNRVTKSLAYGLLARAALYQEDWAGVVSNATLAIDNSGVGLSSIATYSNMWGETDSDGEAIFKIALDPDDGSVGGSFYTDGVGPRYDPTSDILDLYDPNDVRLSSFFMDLAPWGKIISKYFGPPTQRQFHEPFVMRMSEMYLLRAEANNVLGSDGPALADLDALRSNRIPGFTSGGESGAGLTQAIRTERRKELCYEGFRFYDLRRWDLPVDRKDCTADECFLPADDFKFVYAIPRAELFANDNMVQNPGY
jgi:hypothetical protein